MSTCTLHVEQAAGDFRTDGGLELPGVALNGGGGIAIASPNRRASGRGRVWVLLYRCTGLARGLALVSSLAARAGNRAALALVVRRVLDGRGGGPPLRGIQASRRLATESPAPSPIQQCGDGCPL
jgi:hypothetical protein